MSSSLLCAIGFHPLIVHLTQSFHIRYINFMGCHQTYWKLAKMVHLHVYEDVFCAGEGL